MNLKYISKILSDNLPSDLMVNETAYMMVSGDVHVSFYLVRDTRYPEYFLVVNLANDMNIETLLEIPRASLTEETLLKAIRFFNKTCEKYL